MNTIDDLLDTAGRVGGPRPETLAAARARLDAAVARTGREHATTPHRVPRQPRMPRRRVLVLAGVFAVALVGALVVPVLNLGGAPVDSAAAQALRDFAVVAGQQPDTWSQAPYWHTRSVYTNEISEPGETFERDMWVAADPAAVSVLRDTGVPVGDRPLGTGDPGVHEFTVRFSAGCKLWTWAELGDVTTDPVELAAMLREVGRGYGPNPDYELFTNVTGLLIESPASPALRQALWEVAATVPGVTVREDVTDSLGRVGTEVARTEDETSFIVDPNTGWILEWAYSQGVYTFLDQGPATTAPPPDTATPEVNLPISPQSC
jgi:hypothetical protein